MREIIKMVIVLTLITGVSGTLLSFVQKATKDPIENNQLKNLIGPKLNELFPEGERSNDPVAERKEMALVEGGPALKFFPIKKDGELAAVALEVKGKGYGGDLGILVGVNLVSEQMVGMRVTKHSETPGLGARSTEPEFSAQFKDLPLDQPVEVGSPIDAISGATITSTGVCAGVTEALKLFTESRDRILGAFQEAN